MDISKIAWLFLQIGDEVVKDPSVRSADFVNEVCRRFSEEYNVDLEETRMLYDEAFDGPDIGWMEDLP